MQAHSHRLSMETEDEGSPALPSHTYIAPLSQGRDGQQLRTFQPGCLPLVTLPTDHALPAPDV